MTGGSTRRAAVGLLALGFALAPVRAVRAFEALDGRIQVHGFVEEQMRVLDGSFNEEARPRAVVQRPQPRERVRHRAQRHRSDRPALGLRPRRGPLRLRLLERLRHDALGQHLRRPRQAAAAAPARRQGSGIRRRARDRHHAGPPGGPAHPERAAGAVGGPPGHPERTDRRCPLRRDLDQEPREQPGRTWIRPDLPVSPSNRPFITIVRDREGFPGLDALFRTRGPDGEIGENLDYASLSDASVFGPANDDPANYLFTPVLDYVWALRSKKGPDGGAGRTMIMGPWLPKNYIRTIGTLRERANPFRGITPPVRNALPGAPTGQTNRTPENAANRLNSRTTNLPPGPDGDIYPTASPTGDTPDSRILAFFSNPGYGYNPGTLGFVFPNVETNFLGNRIDGTGFGGDFSGVVPFFTPDTASASPAQVNIRGAHYAAGNLPADERRRHRRHRRAAGASGAGQEQLGRVRRAGRAGPLHPEQQPAPRADGAGLRPPRVQLPAGRARLEPRTEPAGHQGAQGGLRRHRGARQPPLGPLRPPEHRVGQDGALPHHRPVQPAGSRARVAGEPRGVAHRALRGAPGLLPVRRGTARGRARRVRLQLRPLQAGRSRRLRRVLHARPRLRHHHRPLLPRHDRRRHRRHRPPAESLGLDQGTSRSEAGSSGAGTASASP